MISQQFERLILEGKADAKTLNVNSGVFNYHVGRGSTIIVENIHLHNFASNIKIIDIDIIAEDLFVTVNIYGDQQSKSITIKNLLQINDVLQGGSTIMLSQLNFNKDLFWIFQTENLCIEIVSNLDSMFTFTTDLTDYPNPTKNNTNPNGFTAPQAAYIEYSGGAFEFNAQQSGTQNNNLAPNNNPTQLGLIIPKFGDGDTAGNALNPNPEFPFGAPLLNVGIIELNKDCKL
jgi:hypothetical protein